MCFSVRGRIIGGSFQGLCSSWWGVLLFSSPVAIPSGCVHLCGTGVVSSSPYRRVGSVMWFPMANLGYGRVVLCRRDWCDGFPSFCFFSV